MAGVVGCIPELVGELCASDYGAGAELASRRGWGPRAWGVAVVGLKPCRQLWETQVSAFWAMAPCPWAAGRFAL